MLSRQPVPGIYLSVNETVNEDELVVRVQKGDLSAFERLLDLHSSPLRAFVAMKLPIPHLIDEIAHETFVFSHRHIMDFKAGTDFREMASGDRVQSDSEGDSAPPATRQKS